MHSKHRAWTGYSGMTFCSCDHDLEEMNLIYEYDVDIAQMYMCTKNELSRSRYSKFRAQTGPTECHRRAILLLWPWPWVDSPGVLYKHNPDILKMYLNTKNKLRGSMLSKVREYQTDTGTDVTEDINMLFSQVVIIIIIIITTSTNLKSNCINMHSRAIQTQSN